MQFVNPPSLPSPRGYNNGVRVGPFLFVAGQPAFGREAKIEGRTLVEQFRRALENVAAVVREGGGNVQAIVKMTIYVKSVAEYKALSKEIGEAYRGVMGRHYPAMTCVEVKELYDEGALVEIEAVAIL